MGEIRASFADKKIIKSIIAVLGLMLWAISAFAGLFMNDDFIFVILSSVLIALGILLPSVIAVIIYAVLASKKELAVSEYGIRGKMISGKVVSLTLDMVQQVEPHGINGIKIIARNGIVYKFSLLENRDYICLALSDLRVAVNPNIIHDKNAVAVSEPDRKKNKVLPIVSLVMAVIGNIFMSASSIWYNSPGNYYYHTYTYTNYYELYGYTYSYPVESGYWGHSYYGYEMFTTYLAILFGLIAIILIAVYIPKINHRISVSAEKVRGVNGFGKVTILPTVQITNAISNSSESAVAVFCSGIKRRYKFIANHMQIVQAINSFRPNAYMPPMQGYTAQPAQPYAQPVAPVQAYAPVQPVAPVQPTAPVQPYAPAAPSVEYAQPAAPVNSTPDVAEEIKNLKELLDSGVITQEDYDAKKKQILGL